MIQIPVAFLTKPENISEQLLAGMSLQKTLLLGGVFIAETRRYGNPLDSEFGGEIKKLRNLICRFTIEKRAVDIDSETLG